MKARHLLPVCFLFLAWNPIWAQQATLTGTVLDSAQAPLKGATVVLLQAQDSILKSFALSEKTGTFLLKRVPVGDYILQITFQGYAQVSEPIQVQEEGELDLGSFQMEPPLYQTDQVNIEGARTPILIKGDTVEYNADAFQTQPNDVVEDLLRKLPGVEVDNDGTVKAQGETVNRVLVEGKEFFGNDPKMATKNLPADAVDKVQVFDKMSEMAEFSGIDDGQRDKTINLELKEDKKQGVFGRVQGGYGTQDRYEGRFNVNRFDPKRQMSALGMLNNTNQQGFSIGDYLSFMGGLQNMMSMGSGGGSMTLSLDSREMGLPISDGGMGNGFINTGAAGINLNQEIGKRTEISSSYFFSHIRNQQTKEVFRQNFLAENPFASTDSNAQVSRNLGHRLNFRLKHELDSFQQIVWRINAGLNDARLESQAQSEVRNGLGERENAGLRAYDSEGQLQNLRTTLNYRRRFRRKGRVFATTLNLRLQDNETLASLFSLNQFAPDNPSLAFTDSVDQSQNQLSQQTAWGARLSYVEPLSKRYYLGFTYEHQEDGNEVDQQVYDHVGSNRSEVLNAQLSNAYKRDFDFDRAGLNLRFVRKDLNINGEVQYQRAILNGDIRGLNTPINKRFHHILPALRLRYEMGTGQHLTAFYDTRMQAPSVEQLQPLVNNVDPLNIYIGNPDLEAEYRHRANLHLVSFSQFSFTSFFANFRASYTQNKITQARSIDSLFRQTVQPINVDRDIRLETYLSFGTPLRIVPFRINIDLNLMYNRGILFVNTQENDLDRLVSTVDLYIDNRRKDLIDFTIGAELSHNLNRYSVSQELNSDFLNQSYYLDFTLNVKKTWSFETRFDYSIYAGDAFNRQETVPLWRASMGYYFLKNRRGYLQLIARDLLNRNIGFSRRSDFNYIEEERILSLGRYLMLSFTYNLSAFGGREGAGGIFLHD